MVATNNHMLWNSITQTDISAASAGMSAMLPYLIQKALPAFYFQRLCLLPLGHACIAAYAGYAISVHPNLQSHTVACNEG